MTKNTGTNDTLFNAKLQEIRERHTTQPETPADTSGEDLREMLAKQNQAIQDIHRRVDILEEKLERRGGKC